MFFFPSQILNIGFEDFFITLHLFLFNSLHFSWLLIHRFLFSNQELVLKHFLVVFFRNFSLCKYVPVYNVANQFKH